VSIYSNQYGESVILYLVIALIILSSTSPVSAEENGFEVAWAWGNSLAISQYFVDFYNPHADALFEAEKLIVEGQPYKDAVNKLGNLPGIKKAFMVSRLEGKTFGIDNESLEYSEFAQVLLQDRHFKTYESPMMGRTLGGKCKFERVKTGNKKYNIMMKPFQIDSQDDNSRIAIGVILDKSWLLDRIPDEMEKLARENSHLLFWADSPRNKQYQQSIGIITGEDTLYWAGSKDVKVGNIQALWPFIAINIHSDLKKTED